MFSSPFIEERLYFNDDQNSIHDLLLRSRPLLSRSGCIYDGIIITVVAVANVAVIACIGKAIIGAKRDFAIDKANGFTEIGDKIYKLAEDGDFITVDQWNEHTK